MKTKTVAIILAAILLLGLGFVYFRSVQEKAAHARRVAAQRSAETKARAAAKRARKLSLPAITKKVANPKVAIVMDDFGYNTNNLDALFAIGQPVTLSVLPHLHYSTQVSERARAHGYEVILHLPLEPQRKDVSEESATINSAMSEKDVISNLNSAINSVPGLKGVSSHMGSKATEETPLMTTILKDLKAKNLYFFDSLTSQKSVCKGVAASIGERYAKRDIFLDNDTSPEAIRRQVMLLRKVAFRNGRAIAVCHDRKNTVKVLGETMPELASEGIRFVYLSEMEK